MLKKSKISSENLNNTLKPLTATPVINLIIKLTKLKKNFFRYIYGRDHHYTRPYSYTHNYATKSNYAPSIMTPDSTNLTSRRSYSGYNYVAAETSFNVSAKPWSLSNYRTLRSPYVTT